MLCTYVNRVTYRDGRYRTEQPDDEYLVFIHDYEVFVTIRCLCLRMTQFMSSMEIIFLRADDYDFSFTFISKL